MRNELILEIQTERVSRAGSCGAFDVSVKKSQYNFDDFQTSFYNENAASLYMSTRCSYYYVHKICK